MVTPPGGLPSGFSQWDHFTVSANKFLTGHKWNMLNKVLGPQDEERINCSKLMALMGERRVLYPSPKSCN